MKIFDIFTTEEVKSEDVGLRKYINLDIKLLVKSRGRHRERFGKGKVSIVERLINELAVPGHRGKKHKIITKVSGKYIQNAKVVVEALQRIQEKTKQNPIQVFVKALENSAPRDEITTIEYGGARYPQAVDTSPLRRLNLALRHIVHGAHDKAFKKRKKLAEALADEITAASDNSNESHAISKKNEAEKQANAAR